VYRGFESLRDFEEEIAVLRAGERPADDSAGPEHGRTGMPAQPVDVGYQVKGGARA